MNYEHLSPSQVDSQTSVPPPELQQRTPEKVGPFGNVLSFDDLSIVLNRMDTIVGADGTVYTTSELRKFVTDVRNGDLALNALTKSEGLRDTVARLLKEEYVAEVAHAESLEALKPIITRMGRIIGVWEEPINVAESLKVIEYIQDGTLTLNDHTAPFFRFTTVSKLRDRVTELSKTHHGHT
jgi:hypothetical protein